MVKTFPIWGGIRPTEAVASVLMAIGKYVGSSELATLLKVNRRTATNYSGRDDFPKPIAFLEATRVWRTSDVLRWAEKTLPLSPGPKPTKRKW